MASVPAPEPEAGRSQAVAEDPDRKDHFYGGQALIEGVMMRGRDHWAVAVRRPDDEIHIESHDVGSLAKKYPILAKPGLRGVIALGQALSIGFRALGISAHQAAPEEERLTKGQMTLSMVLAVIVFIGLFIVLPAVGFGFAERSFLPSGLVANVLEGIVRVLIFLGYLLLIGRMKEVRRVFQYHGAEHKTIAAYEHGSPLEPAEIDKFSTLHVRCGTNFLLIIMVLTILVFALFGSPGLFWRVMSRVIAIPIIAAVAYETLRLGARYPNSIVMRILMTPGLWLQKITTKPPAPDQTEVAIASFNEVLRREQAAATG